MGQKEISNRIEYLVSCVGEFALRHSLTNSQAYAYLSRFLGIDFLMRYYEAEHLLSIDEAVEDLTMICHRNRRADCMISIIKEDMKNQNVQFQIECLTIELAHLLMDEYGWDMNRALDELYNSATYRKLEDERSGLYYQSALYVFQYLKNEMETGIMA